MCPLRSEQKTCVCVYRSEKRWEGVRWDARNRPALGEGEDPVNIEDANIGLESVQVCLEDWGTDYEAVQGWCERRKFPGIIILLVLLRREVFMGQFHAERQPP